MLWVDGVRQHPQQLVDELGLAEIQREESAMIWAPSPAGPNQTAGMLGYWLDRDFAGIPEFHPEKQTWREAPGKKFWIGTHHERPLHPGDIQRHRCPAARTYPVQLEDGNAWRIPSAESLPHLWGMDDAGEHLRVPKDAYKEFCREAERVFLMFVQNNANPDTWQIKADLDYVHTALMLVYKLAPPIIAALGLIGDRSGGEILAATVDMQPILAVSAEKKSGGA
jgi:hypothetical protein